MNKVLLCPERLRRIPTQFSWIDQRLARRKLFCCAPAEAWLLYLFLVTVADARGLSYYGERTLCQHLGLEPAQLARARQALLGLALIAYRAPLYQVLALDGVPLPKPTTAVSAITPPRQARQQLHHIQQLLKVPGRRP